MNRRRRTRPAHRVVHTDIAFLKSQYIYVNNTFTLLRKKRNLTDYQRTRHSLCPKSVPQEKGVPSYCLKKLPRRSSKKIVNPYGYGSMALGTIVRSAFCIT